MAAKARITLGIALLVAAVAVLGRQVAWIFVPLVLLSLFVIVWGKEQRATEAYIKKLPFGACILKILDFLDSIITPRDRDLEERIRQIILGYDADTRTALRKLYRTRNTNDVVSCEKKFVADGFIEYPKDGPGWIKPERRDAVARILSGLEA